MNDNLIDKLAENFQKMMNWNIEHSKSLEHGCILSIRKGEFFDKEWWAVFLEAQIGNEDHLKDIPPQSEWGEYALMSFQSGDRGIVLWVFEDFNSMIMDLSRLFGMFLPSETEH